MTTVDRYHFNAGPAPPPEETAERLGLAATIDFVRIDHSSYTWWLKRQIEDLTDRGSNGSAAYDFCYLDGAHTWDDDGFAVCDAVTRIRPHLAVVLTSAENYEQVPKRIESCGARGFIRKEHLARVDLGRFWPSA